MMPTPADGPSMEQYIETRFNLLTVLIDKLENSIRERINAVEASSVTRYTHASELILVNKATTDATIAENKQTQTAVNVAHNAWRETFNDFKRDTVSRAEFDRLDKSMQEGDARFEAYRLEVAQTIQARQIKESAITEGSRGNRRETQTSITAIVGWAVGAAALASFVFNTGLPTRQSDVAARNPQSEKRVDDVIERLNALSSRLNAVQAPSGR